MRFTKIQIVFLLCWAGAMLGLGAMAVDYVSVGKIMAYGFGIAAMALGFYSFIRQIRERHLPPTE